LIDSRIVRSTFRISYKDRYGTAFSLNRKGKQYLVTARHVVEGIKSGEILNIHPWSREYQNVMNHFDRDQIGFNVTLIGVGDEDIDVAVLSCEVLISNEQSLIADSTGLSEGWSVHILGYPFGDISENYLWTCGLPAPSIVEGVLCGFSRQGETKLLKIDGPSVDGFSGGPVVFRKEENNLSSLQIAGILRGADRIVSFETDDPTNIETTRITGDRFYSIAFDISHAVEIIDANPIGCEILPNQQNSEIVNYTKCEA